MTNLPAPKHPDLLQLTELGAQQAPRPINPVILALILALRDVEQRRGRGKVLTHLTSKRPAA